MTTTQSHLSVPASATVIGSGEVSLLDPTILSAVSADERLFAFQRSEALHERFSKLLDRERSRKMRADAPQAMVPAEVRAALKVAGTEVYQGWERLMNLKAAKVEDTMTDAQVKTMRKRLVLEDCQTGLTPAKARAMRKKLGLTGVNDPSEQLRMQIAAATRQIGSIEILDEATMRALIVAAKYDHPGAKELLIWADPTMCQVTIKERQDASRRSAELYRRYQSRLSSEHRQGARSRDEDMLYPQQIRAATWLDGKNQYLPKQDQRLLAIAAKLGDERAKTILLMSNQHQAIKTAKRVQRKDASLHDMVQSTNVGLLHAIQLYDPHNDRKASFLTFATWHGWQRAMRDGQLSGRTGLSVPPYMDQYCDLVRKVRLHLQQTEQRNEHDLDELLGLVNEGRSKKNLIEMEELERAVALLEVNYQPLDSAWADEEDGRSFSEQIGIEETETVIGAMDHDRQCKQLKMWLQNILGDNYSLYVRNQGLFGHDVESVAEISDTSQLTDTPLSKNQVALRVRTAKKLVSHHIERGSISLAA